MRNSRFNAFLELLSTLLKNVTGLPKSYNKTKALLWKLGFGYVAIHVCKYDCALFWKDHENDDHGPVCGESRWKHLKWIINQAALLVQTLSRASVDIKKHLNVMKQTTKMKMKPSLRTIVNTKRVYQKKTVMMTNLCISRAICEP